MGEQCKNMNLVGSNADLHKGTTLLRKNAKDCDKVSQDDNDFISWVLADLSLDVDVPSRYKMNQ
ncbi:hypothetical protein EAG18_08585 [Pseudoalteromonas sp. J010]|uniref:hypothetical protein n=2 Tax=Pseudoalteromonas TaxID=53246 RepID=UPI000FC02DCD|nr:hypothetical protein [Pseudoalteromonas peptidolytica]MDW7551257.1 hypothetical protein [Pseudoalteromonas peptidolytica]RRS09167.1 hypothetical protein EAG18_08585 [Pseudoalteromonas sp. J010]RXF01041.1 hypothetical protein D9603_14160 [Pseudoalteromonas sp. PS5]